MHTQSDLAQDGYAVPPQPALLLALDRRVTAAFDFATNALSRFAANPKAVGRDSDLHEVLERLKAHARMHQLLSQQSSGELLDCGAYLSTLCDDIQAAFLKNQPITVSICNESVWMADCHARRLGLLTHELVLNAADYAFDETGGTISILLSQEGSTVECSVRDDGMRLCSVNPVLRGRGMTHVDELARSMDAACIWHLSPTVTEATVVMDVSTSACQPFDTVPLQPGNTSPMLLSAIRRVSRYLYGNKS